MSSTETTKDGRFFAAKEKMNYQPLWPTMERCSSTYRKLRNLNNRRSTSTVVGGKQSQTFDLALQSDTFNNSATRKYFRRYLTFLEENQEIPPEGMPLSDVYTLVRKIGSGGSGQIYLAKDVYLDVFCAVKIIYAGRVQLKNVKDNFFNEIKITAKLRHPNIVNIFYANYVEDYYYYVMEYINGENCADIIKKREMREDEVVNIAIALSGALTHAHQSGVIHRDIKPANIMLDENNMVKLMDLGIAVPILAKCKHSQSKRIEGTPLYLAPEQIRGIVNEQSDIYSFGATLYHLLTRQLPFRGKNVNATLQMVINPNLLPMPPCEIRPYLSADISHIVLKCLAKNPAQRFQSMEQILETLKALKN